ncbi:MAG: RNA polymerase sigma factor [Bacteroidales bacterium]
MKRLFETSDSELLMGLKKGDPGSFEVLFRKYKGKIYNFIMNASQGDFYLAEEIVQNVFIKIWELRNDLVIEGSFSTLLYTMSKNMFYNSLRRKVQDSIYQDYYKSNCGESDYLVDKDVEYRMLEEEIARLIEKLPPARRQVYHMSRREHRSNKEIASALKISENTVESHLTKANAFLRHMLSVKYMCIPLIMVIL